MNSSGTQSSGQASESVQAGGLAYLDQALWKRFHSAESIEEFAAAWLTLQCSMLDRVEAGVVVLGGINDEPYLPVAIWPDGSASSPALSAAAEAALDARKGIVNQAEEGACAAYPVKVDGRLHGVAAVEFLHGDETDLRRVMRQLQWGCGWLEAQLRRPGHATDMGTAGDAGLAVELAALILEAERFQEAATAVVTELATRLDLERASLGVRRGKHTKVVALSHSAQFGKSSNLTNAIATAMDEAIDQFTAIVYPRSAEQVQVDRAHDDLVKMIGDHTICTIPLAHGGELFGALTLDAPASRPFDEERLHTIDRITSFIGPVLATKYAEDRWIGRKLWDSWLNQLQRLFGPRYAGRKLAAMIVAALAIFFTFATDTYRVQASATLEGAVERVAVAPIAGYIIEANVRAGDVVREGDPLFRIDDRDLRLEFLRWSSQKEQIQRQQRDAFAQHERSEVNILRAQLDQAESQLTLIGEQISRTRGVAPFDGIVVSGDLSDQLGAPVERGQILFKIAPLDEYRVALQVSETDVSDIDVGQAGQLVLASHPDRKIPIKIESITPVSAVVGGKNTFRVEASLGETPEFLRPGMQGAARIEVEPRRLAWIWTHEMLQWLRLWLWSWWP